jgi:ligand-binding SRPBCC domain-containing protein
MPVIKLETKINAPVERVFDLARSIDLHTKSASKSNEEAIGGRTSGLINFGETVTWRAKHLGVRQTLTSKITHFERPLHFRDSMQKGIFKRIDHDHFFEKTENGTLMRDTFDYDAPLWIFGKIADRLFLEKYMTDFLIERNRLIKEIAESEKWKEFILIEDTSQQKV